METIEIDGARYVLALDLAKKHNVGRATIHNAIKDDRLPGVLRFGRMWVPLADAEAWEPQRHGGNRGGGRPKKTTAQARERGN